MLGWGKSLVLRLCAVAGPGPGLETIRDKFCSALTRSLLIVSLLPVLPLPLPLTLVVKLLPLLLRYHNFYHHES